MSFKPNQPNRFIVDISHHNSDIDFDVARQHVGYFIARTGDGHRVNTNGERQGVLDRKYKQFTSQMKAKGIPFGNYMFNRFSGVASARQEAEDFWVVGDKAATSWVCDAEVSTAPNMLECIQVFVDRLRELGAKKVGLYIGHHKYKEFNGAAVKNVDFIWIPRYGAEPSFKCDLWQFTETGSIPGIGKCDINVSMNDSKPVSWYYQGSQSKQNIIQTGGNQMTEQNKNNQPSDWAKPAWEWALEKGLIDKTVDPQKVLTTEELIGILMQYHLRADRY